MRNLNCSSFEAGAMTLLPIVMYADGLNCILGLGFNFELKSGQLGEGDGQE